MAAAPSSHSLVEARFSNERLVVKVLLNGDWREEVARKGHFGVRATAYQFATVHNQTFYLRWQAILERTFVLLF